MADDIRVLLVEDNTDHIFLSQRSFAEHKRSFRVEVAFSGREATERLESGSGNFHIAFVDYQLPDIDGMRLLANIKSGYPDLPVVITTGQGSEELAVAVFRLGAADYIIKNENYFALLPQVAETAYERAHARQDKTLWAIRVKLDDVYSQIVQTAAKVSNSKVASLMLYNEGSGQLEVRAQTGLSCNYSNVVRPSLGQSIEGLAVAESRPVYAADIHEDVGYAYKDMATAEGIRSVLSVPVTFDRDTKGVINVYSRRRRAFSLSDADKMSDVMRLSVLALENLKLYLREHRIAETLQRSHLPEIGPRLGHWQIAYRYKASMEESLLGGDFYDLFALDGSRYAVVVADVSGKGLEAAAQTAMVKYSLRSYALQDHSPRSALTKLNEAFFSYVHSDHFVTLFYGTLEPENGSIIYASAGHPPAMLYQTKTGRCLAVETEPTHIPIGISRNGLAYEASRLELAAGDALLLYTDGVTDCRRGGFSRGELLGQEALASLFERVAGEPAEAAAAAIYAELMNYSNRRLRDDIAFLVLKYDPTQT